MFCKKCGTKIKSKYIFCPICGSMAKIHISRKSDADMAVLANAVKQLKAGNEEGFSLIYFHTYQYVYNRAKYMLKDEHEAHDLTHDVYMALYNGIGEIRDENALYGWLKTVVFRQGIRFIEKKRKSKVVSDDAEFMFDVLPDECVKIEESYNKKEEIRTVKKCIDMLSEEQRLVILAYYYDNMSVKEIAKVLEISEGTVKSRLYLARKHLLDMLEEEEKKQGYKFFAAGLPLITPALESTLKVNAKIARETIIANYKNFCEQASIEETPALLKTTGIAGKTAGMIAGASFRNIIIKIASFIVVGGIFGAVILTGSNAANEVLDSPETQKAGREVELAEIQDAESAEPADNIETVETISNTSVAESNQTASENGAENNQTALENGNVKGDNTAEDDDEPVNVDTVSGLKYNFAEFSDDMNLSWDPVPGADGYEVYVATSEYPTYRQDSTVSTTKCTVLTGGAYYHVKVRAYRNKDGKKVYGPFCSEISTEPDIVFPQNISISSVRQDGEWVVVNVDPFTVDYHSEITLYRATSADGSYESVGRVNCNPGQTVTVSEICDIWPNEHNRFYYYKIRIKAFKTWPGKSDKYSNYSNVISYQYRIYDYEDDTVE